MAEASTQARPAIERVGADAIRLERVLAAPPEKVWRYLTEAELRRQWFMGGMDAVAGGEFELLNDHDNLSEEDVPYPESYAPYKGRTWSEQVVRFEPPHVLATTFQGGKNGIVTYELFPEGEGTRLVLTHSGIESPTGSQDFGSGWTSHLAVLEEKLAGRGVRDFWALHARSREAVKAALDN
ncbi:SRPBCC family protein [Sphingomonas sp.]|uniref:SRPBCC family protein n=1 Tax=Sphingomonas sp. TaxID=28214 RepID=UPI0025DF9632|nr:SRPBCC family protein [Sphingomonas sp.]MBV9527370.1 SRPBCC family protein [Sphingomonas sp.]